MSRSERTQLIRDIAIAASRNAAGLMLQWGKTDAAKATVEYAVMVVNELEAREK